MQAVTYSTFENNHICRESAANAFLVYLEPRERVWWLQYPNPSLVRAN